MDGFELRTCAGNCRDAKLLTPQYRGHDLTMRVTNYSEKRTEKIMHFVLKTPLRQMALKQLRRLRIITFPVHKKTAVNVLSDEMVSLFHSFPR